MHKLDLFEPQGLSNTAWAFAKLGFGSPLLFEGLAEASLGKLAVNFDPVEIALASGFELLEFSAHDALALQDLPFHHRDPFDRILVAQAQAEALTLITRDPDIAKYDVSRLVC